VHFLGNFTRTNQFGETVGGNTLGELQALVEALAGLQHGGSRASPWLVRLRTLKMRTGKWLR
jgi:hypothetical protein